MRLLPTAPRSGWRGALTLVRGAGLQKPPSCWAVLSQDRVTIVLLAVGQDLYLLDNTSCSVVVSDPRRPSEGSGAVCGLQHPLAGSSPVPCCPTGSRDTWPGQRGEDKAGTAWEGTALASSQPLTQSVPACGTFCVPGLCPWV